MTMFGKMATLITCKSDLFLIHHARGCPQVICEYISSPNFEILIIGVLQLHYFTLSSESDVCGKFPKYISSK